MRRVQYEGELTYVPVMETLPAGYAWGINVTSCTFGNITVILNSTAGIVDTGTTMFPPLVAKSLVKCCGVQQRFCSWRTSLMYT